MTRTQDKKGRLRNAETAIYLALISGMTSNLNTSDNAQTRGTAQNVAKTKIEKSIEFAAHPQIARKSLNATKK